MYFLGKKVKFSTIPAVFSSRKRSISLKLSKFPSKFPHFPERSFLMEVPIYEPQLALSLVLTILSPNYFFTHSLLLSPTYSRIMNNLAVLLIPHGYQKVSVTGKEGRGEEVTPRFWHVNNENPGSQHFGNF